MLTSTYHFKSAHKRELFNKCLTPAFVCDAKGCLLDANAAAEPLLSEQQTKNLWHIFDIERGLLSEKDKHCQVVPLIQDSSGQSLFLLYVDKLDEKEQTYLVRAQPQLKDFNQPLGVRERPFFYDALTGLANHYAWYRRDQHRLYTEPSALVLIKLHNLRAINILVGMQSGDELLRELGESFKALSNESMHIYRFPGAKFLLVLNQPVASLKKWLHDNLSQLLSEQLSFHDLQGMHLEWRAGATLYRHQVSAQALMEECSIAMAHASPSQPYVCYRNEYQVLIAHRNRQQNRIYQALEDEQLELWLQPQTLDSGQIVGYECLCRLKDAHGVIIPPDEFLPYVDLNNWYAWLAQLVWARACELLSDWDDRLGNVPISINLAGPELLDERFYQMLLKRYSQSALLRQRLALELTETSMVGQLAQTKQRLSSLAQAGVTVLIDDFGTGHASLAQLVDLSISVLKIDRLFVSHVLDSAIHSNIIKASIQLADSLDMRVIVEGVETSEELEALKALGCKMFQGFYFGHPQPYQKLLERFNP